MKTITSESVKRVIEIELIRKQVVKIILEKIVSYR